MPSQRGVITVAAMFDRAQRNKATHRKAAHNLMKLQKHDAQQFTEEFISQLRRAMVVKQKAASVDRVVQFAVYFAVNTPMPASVNGTEQPFYALVLKFMIQISVAKTAAARYRACQCIAAIILSLPEETELDDDLYEAALDALEIRVKDKDQSTRVEAARALACFQDPDDPDCAVTPQFLRMLENDSVTAVRKQVLNCLITSKSTIGTIIGRTRDKVTDIRKHAFAVLTSKVDVRALTIKQRCFVLETGLNDREEKVREECAKMLNSWYKSKSSNVLEFLRCLHIELNESTAEKALNCILKDRSLDQSVHATIVRKEIVDAVARMSTEDPVLLTNEKAFFWRVYCDFFEHEVDQDSELYLPEVARYCALILFHHQLDIETQAKERSHSDFVIKQLLKLAHRLYLGDETQRKMFSGLLCDLLISPETPASLVEEFMRLINTIHNPDESIALAIENISRMQEPLAAMKDTMGKELEKIETRLEEMIKEMQFLKKLKARHIAEENFEKAMEAKMDMKALQEEARPLEEQRDTYDTFDEYVNQRSLQILAVLLRSLPKAMTNHNILEMDNAIVEKCLSNDSFDVVRAALECRALFCFEDREKAKNSIKFFTDVLQDANQDPQVQLTAMKSVFDLMTVYSVTDMELAYADAQGIEDAAASEGLVKLMVQYVDFDGDSNVLMKRQVEGEQEVPEAAIERAALVRQFRTAAVDGFARLYFLEAISPDNQWYDKVLAQLVLLFFSSDSAEQNEIRQCLSVFFSAFTALDKEHHFTVFERIFMPTLRLLFNQHITVKAKRKKRKTPAPAEAKEGEKAVGVVAVDSEGLKDIKYKEIGFFFLDVTAPRADAPLLEQKAGIHERLAADILKDIVSEESDSYTAKEFKALTMLLSKCCIDRATVETLDSISSLIQEALSDVLTDRTAANTTKKVAESIAAYRAAAEAREAAGEGEQLPANEGEPEAEGEGEQLPANEAGEPTPSIDGSEEGATPEGEKEDEEDTPEEEEQEEEEDTAPSSVASPAPKKECEENSPKAVPAAVTGTKKTTPKKAAKKKTSPKRKPLQRRTTPKRKAAKNAAEEEVEESPEQEVEAEETVAKAQAAPRRRSRRSSGQRKAEAEAKEAEAKEAEAGEDSKEQDGVPEVEVEKKKTPPRKKPSTRTPRKAAAVPRTRKAPARRRTAVQEEEAATDEKQLLPKKRVATTAKQAPAATRRKKAAPLAQQPAVAAGARRGPLKSVFAL